jgi:methylmalonyl-CoA mutase
MRIVSEFIASCSRHLPRYKTVSISGYHFMEAGANSVIQTAFTLADGKEYIGAAIAAESRSTILPPCLLLLRVGEFFFGDRHAQGRPAGTSGTGCLRV